MYKLFFEEGRNIIEIAEEIGVTKQNVSKILNTYYKDQLEEEKQRRKDENLRSRQEKKARKRREDSSYDFDIIAGLKEQQSSNAVSMSRSRKISNEGIVFNCLSAYDVNVNKGATKLVYNEKLGKRPNDLPASLPLKVTIYK